MIKDYLGYEHDRNKRNAALYERLIKAALAVQGHNNVAVLIGHHLTFELDGDLQTENEIPSADCLMFDHDFMGAVFGDAAVPIMRYLAETGCDKRDALLEQYLQAKEFEHVNA